MSSPQNVETASRRGHGKPDQGTFQRARAPTSRKRNRTGQADRRGTERALPTRRVRNAAPDTEIPIVSKQRRTRQFLQFKPGLTPGQTGQNGANRLASDRGARKASPQEEHRCASARTLQILRPTDKSKSLHVRESTASPSSDGKGRRRPDRCSAYSEPTARPAAGFSDLILPSRSLAPA